MAKEIVLPEGFEIDKIENGKIILKEVESPYPKTWGKCVQRLGKGEFINSSTFISHTSFLSNELPSKHDKNLLPIGYGRKVLALCQLLVCRNAYWGNWTPNWKDVYIKYTIRMHKDTVSLEDARFYQRVLAFPTREMRDAFYENFKDLIEEAKDLL